MPALVEKREKNGNEGMALDKACELVLVRVEVENGEMALDKACELVLVRVEVENEEIALDKACELVLARVEVENGHLCGTGHKRRDMNCLIIICERASCEAHTFKDRG